MRQSIPYVGFAVALAAVFGWYYLDYYDWAAGELKGNGDYILNFAQTVDSAERFLRFDFGRFWDMGEFFPFLGTKALSDHQFLPGLVVALFSLVGVDYPSGFFLWLLLCFVLSGVTFTMLLRHLGVSFALAALGACLFTVSQFKTAHFAHTQLSPLFFYPLILLALLRYRERPSAWQGVWAGIWITALGLTSPYLFVFLIPALLCFTPVLLYAELRSWSWLRVGLLASVGLLCVGALWQLYHPYQLAHAYFGMVRGHHERAMYSFSGAGLLSSYGLQYPLAYTRSVGINVESMGYLPLSFWLLSVLAVFALPRVRRSQWPLLLALLGMAGMYGVLAWGPTSRLGVAVWDVLAKLPGFEGIRSPGRMILWVQLLLILWVCVVSHAFWRSLSSRLANVILALMMVVHVIELKPAPVALGTTHFKWAQQLDQQLEATYPQPRIKVPAVMYPFYALDNVHLLSATQRFHFVNGASGFTPFSAEHWIFPQLAFGSSKNAKSMLEKLGVELLVFDRSRVADAEAARMAKELGALLEAETPHYAVYATMHAVRDTRYRSDAEFFAQMQLNTASYQCQACAAVEAYPHPEDARFALQPGEKPHWSSGSRQQEGQWLQVDVPADTGKKLVLRLAHQVEPSPNTLPSLYLRRFDFLRRLQVEDQQGRLLKYKTKLGFYPPKMVQQISIKVDAEVKQVKIAALPSRWVDNYWSVTDLQACRKRSYLSQAENSAR
ncbi:MAG: hypothetical protein OXT67_02340 [Zetaproteobacteria bacterium]|nr:hypothetical protein [Zetaproteobacteria bacterium]